MRVRIVLGVAGAVIVGVYALVAVAGDTTTGAKATKSAGAMASQFQAPEEKGRTDSGPDLSICRLEGTVVTVGYQGDIVLSVPGRAKASSSVPLPAGGTSVGVESVRCVAVQGAVLLAVTAEFLIDGGDFGGGVVLRIQKATGRRQWSVQVPGAVTGSLVAGDGLYVAGYRFIGKVDLGTGKFLWKHATEGTATGPYYGNPTLVAGEATFCDTKGSTAVTVDGRTGRVISTNGSCARASRSPAAGTGLAR